MSDANKILNKIRNSGKGAVFATKDFLYITGRDNADKILSRLVKSNILVRLMRGIYYYPSHYKGYQLLADTSRVAYAIARQHNYKIYPSPAQSANSLGLSNQVPANIMYLISGRSVIYKVGNNIINFKHAPIDFPSNSSNLIIMIINSFLFLGKNNIDDKILIHLSQFLSDKDKRSLLKLCNRVKSWMIKPIQQLAMS